MSLEQIVGYLLQDKPMEAPDRIRCTRQSRAADRDQKDINLFVHSTIKLSTLHLLPKKQTIVSATSTGAKRKLAQPLESHVAVKVRAELGWPRLLRERPSVKGREHLDDGLALSYGVVCCGGDKVGHRRHENSFLFVVVDVVVVVVIDRQENKNDGTQSRSTTTQKSQISR
jgi:hypothetical protein